MDDICDDNEIDFNLMLKVIVVVVVVLYVIITIPLTDHVTNVTPNQFHLGNWPMTIVNVFFLIRNSVTNDDDEAFKTNKKKLDPIN